MDIIDQFISHYVREFDYYERVGQIAAERLEAAIGEAGIRGIVTSRAKDPSRLRDKCLHRNGEKNYSSADEIYEDIYDLAGVRVALYFPNESAQVSAIVTKLFEVGGKTKEFPRDGVKKVGSRFPGYLATHHRVRLRVEDLAEPDARYASALIEVQIASVLMHAWSEVEHDLGYKPLAGPLSPSEHAILDELNGLVHAGEIALERLQDSGRLRVTLTGSGFANHYELASYLAREVDIASVDSTPGEDARRNDALDGVEPKPISSAEMGRVDLLFALLRQLDIADSDGLKPYLTLLHNDFERRPLAEQVIDAIIDDNDVRFRLYREIVESLAGAQSDRPAGVDEAVGSFLNNWRELEGVIREVSVRYRTDDRANRPISFLLRPLFEAGVLDEAMVSDIDLLRRLRNQLVHSREQIPAEALVKASRRTERVLAEVRRRLDEPRPE
jgi:ppGpp synthetase/RelA/SpoT-type nucleotidyltranferase